MGEQAEISGGEAVLVSIGRAGGRDLLTEALELGIDETLDAGMLRDLPVVGWAVKGAGVAAAVRDRLFAKKLIGFIAGTSSASAAKTRTFLDELVEPTARRRAGETLLALIERHERVEKSFVLGRLLVSRIEGHIGGQRFMELAAALDRATIDELRLIKRLQCDERIDDLDTIWGLARTGMVTVQFNEVNRYVAMGHYLNPLGIQMVQFGLGDLDVGVNAPADFP